MSKYILLLICVLAGCKNQSNSIDDAKIAIKKQNEKLHQVIATKNVELLKEVYSEDANFLAPGLAPVKGRDKIISLWKEGLDDILEMHSESIEIGGTVDVLYEVGIVENKIKYHNPDTVIVHKAKYNNVWKRDNSGEYRLVVDIFNKME